MVSCQAHQLHPRSIPTGQPGTGTGRRVRFATASSKWVVADLISTNASERDCTLLCSKQDLLHNNTTTTNTNTNTTNSDGDGKSKRKSKRKSKSESKSKSKSKSKSESKSESNNGTSTSTSGDATGAEDNGLKVVVPISCVHEVQRDGAEVELFRADVNMWLPGRVVRLNLEDGTYIVELFAESEVSKDYSIDFWLFVAVCCLRA